jgi:hypothetical protein
MAKKTSSPPPKQAAQDAAKRRAIVLATAKRVSQPPLATVLAGNQMPPSPITSPKIKHLAGVGAGGGTLTKHEVRELATSVLAHIEPRKKPLR